MSLNKCLGYLYFFMVLIVVSSCEYQIDKTYFRDVKKDVPLPDLTIDLNLTSDTIYVYSISNIKLSLKLTNKKLYAVKFYVNNTEVDHVNMPDANSYSFNISMYSQPMTKVKAEIYTSTETGSIADKVNSESFVFKTKEWVLIYCSDKTVITTEILDGRLKLSWTPIRNSNGKYFIYAGSLRDSTTNPWYIDSTYIGGMDTYSVIYLDNEVSGYGISSNVYYPYPKAFINNKDSFIVYWNKCKFYNNIKGYRIKLGSTILEIKKPTDTVFVYKNGKFGDFSQFAIDLLKNNFDKIPLAYFTFGQPYAYYQLSFVPRHNYLYFPLNGPIMYYNNANKTYKFSLDTKSTIDSIVGTYNYLAVSPNNKYIICNGSDNLKILKSDGMVLIKTIPAVKAGNAQFSTSLNISDIGTSVFYDYVKNSLIVYDFISETITNEIPISTYVQQYKFSADGKYIFEQKLNTLYKLVNTSYAKIWSNENISNQFRFFEFSPVDPNQIALYDGNLLYLKKCDDFSTISSFSLNNTTIANIDFYNKLVLTYNNFMFYVYSMVNGNLLYSIPSYYYLNDSRLFNNYIFSGFSQLNLNNQ